MVRFWANSGWMGPCILSTCVGLCAVAMVFRSACRHQLVTPIEQIHDEPTINSQTQPRNGCDRDNCYEIKFANGPVGWLEQLKNSAVPVL